MLFVNFTREREKILNERKEGKEMRLSNDHHIYVFISEPVSNPPTYALLFNCIGIFGIVFFCNGQLYPIRYCSIY